MSITGPSGTMASMASLFICPAAFFLQAGTSSITTRTSDRTNIFFFMFFSLVSSAQTTRTTAGGEEYSITYKKRERFSPRVKNFCAAACV